MTDFLVGVNYLPADKFIQFWKQFNLEQITHDFQQIKQKNFKVIRIFLTWEDFQPQPDQINQLQLNNLNQLLSIADQLELKVIPTLLVGHMSGPNWLPVWLKSEQTNGESKVFVYNQQKQNFLPKDLYSDPQAVEAEKLLISEVVKATHQHTSIYLWDIGNEIEKVQPPSDNQSEWLNNIYQSIKQIDPQHPITIGSHIYDIDQVGFYLESLSQLDIISIHSYPYYFGKPIDDLNYLETLVQLIQKVNKPYLLAEFGFPTSPDDHLQSVSVQWDDNNWTQLLLTQAKQAEFIERVLKRAKELGCQAGLIWNYADYDQKLFGQLPFDQLVHERYFGVINNPYLEKLIL